MAWQLMKSEHFGDNVQDYSRHLLAEMTNISWLVLKTDHKQSKFEWSEMFVMGSTQSDALLTVK